MPRIQTPHDVIRRAIALTGIHPHHEDIPVSLLTDGLNILNDILDEWGGTGLWIPYLTELTFALQAKKCTYTVSESISADINAIEIIQIQEACLLQGEQRFNLDILSESQFYRSRQNNVLMRPQGVLLRQIPRASQLVFDQAPDVAYQVTLLVKQRLREVELLQPFTEVPAHYLRALAYQIALDMAAMVGASVSPFIASRAEKLLSNLLASNMPDLTVNTCLEF